MIRHIDDFPVVAMITLTALIARVILLTGRKIISPKATFPEISQ